MIPFATQIQLNDVFIERKDATMTTGAPPVIGPGDGKQVQLGAIGARFMIDREASGGGFSLVEHPMSPRALGAPLHRHAHEDEYSYVLAGRVGVQLGDDVVYGKPGDLIVKPRGQWHAFWNAGDEAARVLEIISPGGFERYFERAAGLFSAGGPPNPDALVALADEYGLEFDLASIPRLMQEHGLR
jgi:mannose-6-phosphate isomerase-like protein (cupin superfamily)